MVAAPTVSRAVRMMVTANAAATPGAKPASAVSPTARPSAPNPVESLGILPDVIEFAADSPPAVSAAAMDRERALATVAMLENLAAHLRRPVPRFAAGVEPLPAFRGERVDDALILHVHHVDG